MAVSKLADKHETITNNKKKSPAVSTFQVSGFWSLKNLKTLCGLQCHQGCVHGGEGGAALIPPYRVPRFVFVKNTFRLKRKNKLKKLHVPCGTDGYIRRSFIFLPDVQTMGDPLWYLSESYPNVTRMQPYF